jgi:hypothetical protein
MLEVETILTSLAIEIEANQKSGRCLHIEDSTRGLEVAQDLPGESMEGHQEEYCCLE